MVRINGTLTYGRSTGTTLNKVEFLTGLANMSFDNLALMLEIINKGCPVKAAKHEGIKLIMDRLYGRPIAL